MTPPRRSTAAVLLLTIVMLALGSACSNGEPTAAPATTPAPSSSTAAGAVSASTSTVASSTTTGAPGDPNRPKQAPKPSEACSLVSAAVLTQVFGANPPKGDNTTAGPIPTSCEWKQGSKDLMVEISGDGGWDFMKHNPDLHFTPYADAGVEAIISDTFRKDGKEVGLKLAKGTIEVTLRPNPVDPALLRTVVVDIVTNAPNA